MVVWRDAVTAGYRRVNVAITPAVSATLDVQVVRSGLDRFVESGRVQRMDTSVVGGLRLYVRF